ncbi:hypothetical protein JZ751_013779 [Albula glossodonta]|uniref:Negative regulator of reactive oxygen species n=1 Tax=Albula glossodonta TaxID=121402 RepID=A0A8T2NTR7_9TELE|nr:hypothetical protein JZ751_013779 [Albula glossodonta]
MVVSSTAVDVKVANPAAHLQRSALCDRSRLSSVPADLPEYIEELRLNHNAIRVLRNGCLSYYPHLQVLSCASCQLEAVEPNAFNNSRHIENLNLAENSVSAGYQQTGQALRLLSQLKVLDLSGNGLTEDMVTFLLRNMSSLQRLSLTRNILLRLDQTIFSDLHRLEELTLEKNLLYEIEDGAFDRLGGLQRLSLAFNSLPCLENFRLTQLQVLNASYNYLDWFISDQDMKEPFHLQTLDLRNNRLLFFPFLPTLSQLQTLLLSNNRVGFYQHLAKVHSLNWPTEVQFYNLKGNISNVTVELWDESLHGDISSLELLDLTRNLVVNLPQGFLGKMPKLSRLRLGMNCLESFDLEELPAFLYELDLSSNMLTQLQINQSSLSMLGNLSYLNLSLNDLQRLPTTLFKGLPNLTTVDLSYNKVDICTSEESDSCMHDCGCVSWANVSSLRHLHIKGCGLRLVPPSAFNGTPITHLELSDNPGIILRRESLANLKGTLQELGLGNTKIQDFDFSAFVHLRSIDLSRNSLSHLPDSLGSPPLRCLDLRDNNLISIPFQQAEALSDTLQTIFLGGNPLNCCEMDWYRIFMEIKTVNIADLPKVTCFHAVHGEHMVDSLSGHLCRIEDEEPGWWYILLFLPVCLSLIGIAVILILNSRSRRVPEVPRVIKKRCLSPTSY